MTFAVDDLRPTGVNSATDNRAWFYVSTIDDLSTILVPGYFNNQLGNLKVNDAILIVSTDSAFIAAVDTIIDQSVTLKHESPALPIVVAVTQAFETDLAQSVAVGTETARALALQTGLRTVFVAKTGNDGNNGLSVGQAKLTIQGGANILQAGDVMLVGDGVYVERPTFTNIAGTVANPVWVAAENPGEVTISDEWQAPRNGTQSWTNAGGGVFSATHGDVYVGEHDGDFLLSYRSEAALRASAVEGSTKPARGLAFEGGTVFVRLRNDVNPNGENIFITETFSRDTVTFNNCDNLIFDGFRVEGSGNSEAINFNANCANPTATNCVATKSRFLVRTTDDGIVDYNDFAITGMGAWCAEVNALNPSTFNAFFPIIKDHFADGPNAFLEGGLATPEFGTAGDNIVISRNYCHDVFDGDRFGEYSNSDQYLNLFENIADDCVQFEGSVAADGSELRHYNNKYINCFGPIHSLTGAGLNGNTFIFRNIMEVTDASVYQIAFIIKTIALAANLNGHYFHNLIRMVKTSGQNHFWYDFSNGNAQRILNMFNNIVITDATVGSSTGGNPQVIEGGAFAGPSPNSTIQGVGGVYAGVGEAAMKLNADFTLQSDSPARGIGRTMPVLLRNTDELIGGTATSVDSGPFPFGFTPSVDWPRPRGLAFNESVVPERWTL